MHTHRWYPQWVRFAAAMLVVVALITSSVTLMRPAADAADTPAAIEACIGELINTSRAAAGVGQVQVSTVNLSYARSHSQAMADSGDLFHSTTDQLYTVMGAVNAQWAGENVGMVSPSDCGRMHDAYMASPGHKANILHADATLVTVGAVVVDGVLWTTELFFEAPTGSTTTTTSSPTTTTTTAGSGSTTTTTAPATTTTTTTAPATTTTTTAPATTTTTAPPATTTTTTTTTPIPEVVIPDVAGMTADDAHEVLHQAGSDHVHFNYEPSLEEPGTVLGTSPKAGTTASGTTDIILHIAEPALIEYWTLHSNGEIVRSLRSNVRTGEALAYDGTTRTTRKRSTRILWVIDMRTIEPRNYLWFIH